MEDESNKRVTLLEVSAGVMSRAEACRRLGITDDDLTRELESLEKQVESGALGVHVHPPDPSEGPYLFRDLVLKHFAYLMNDFGFGLMCGGQHDELIPWQVTLESPTTRIRFIQNEWISIRLNPLPNQPTPPLWLQSYDSSSYDLMEIISWTTHSLTMMRYKWPRDFAVMNRKEMTEWQLAHLSPLLLRHARPFLQGDFAKLGELTSYADDLRHGRTPKDNRRI